MGHETFDTRVCSAHPSLCIISAIFFQPSKLKRSIMEIKHILTIMFVVFCIFMLANWLNRPKKPYK